MLDERNGAGEQESRFMTASPDNMSETESEDEKALLTTGILSRRIHPFGFSLSGRDWAWA